MFDGSKELQYFKEITGGASSVFTRSEAATRGVL